MRLPVIVGMGGVNAAGRSSGLHAYKRMVYEALSDAEMKNTWSDLVHRMGLSQLPEELQREKILQGTLLRRIDSFNPNHVYSHETAELETALHLADTTLEPGKHIYWPKHQSLKVQSAACLPKGFHPERLYHSHHHPRGLILSIYGMSDALSSLGMDWQTILDKISPDQVSVYAGSALGQVDDHSFSALMAGHLKGQRANSKLMPLSLAEMPADFINSYVLNSLGATGHNMGACATFLYNLRMGIYDIQAGRAKIAVVGSAEAPLVPEIIEGFRVMGALATDDDLCQLDGSEHPDYRRSCRPFSNNCGFVMGEASQFCILMADDFALEVGAPILGSVADVFVNADANKKSIASPGVGNYVTVAKTAALARAILGDKGLQATYVQAHGTGTPQNRTTESHILNEVAKSFSIKDWRVCAVKSYVGHTIGVAAGDQIMASLGAWQYGVLPGIKTIHHIADDVYHDHLNILMDHERLESAAAMKAVLINSKGFGGNNASALILSPEQTQQMLKKKYGQAKYSAYSKQAEKIKEQQADIDAKTCAGEEKLVYHFGDQMMGKDDVNLTAQAISMSKFAQKIALDFENPYKEYV